MSSVLKLGDPLAPKEPAPPPPPPPSKSSRRRDGWIAVVVVALALVIVGFALRNATRSNETTKPAPTATHTQPAH